MTDEYVEFEFPMPAELSCNSAEGIAPLTGAIIAQLAVREYEFQQQLKRNYDAPYKEYLQAQAAEVSGLLRKLKRCSLHAPL